LILSDITEHIVRERAEREQRELVALFQRITADRTGFDEFLEEAGGLVASLATPGDPLVERRTVHTLKGNCAIYGFERYAELCHAIETELADSPEPLSTEHRTRLADAWHKQMTQMQRLLGESRRNIIEVEFADLSRLIEKAKQGMARRLGTGDIEVEIADDGVRLDTSRWTAFWSAMIHAVRNAVDHGIESPEARAKAGKPGRPKLTFVAARGRGRLMISVTDDGAGINWEKVRAKAAAAGLPAETRGDLELALFADGITTSDHATDTSGRGVGMAALRDAVQALGGLIEIESQPGQGTTMRFRFPEADGQILPLRPPTQPNFRTA
jgi:two-component system chemotaxis sensor kinase CheA